MSELKPLWSDGKTEHHIDCAGDNDPVMVITNLYEDVKCLKEREQELQTQLDIQSDIINKLDAKNKHTQEQLCLTYKSLEVRDIELEDSNRKINALSNALKGELDGYPELLAFYAKNEPECYMRHVTKSMMIEFT